MAVYERRYRGYDGPLTPERTRFLVLTRYAMPRVFASKMFIVFLVLCAVYPAVCAFGLYLPHNLNFLKVIQIDPADWIRAVEEFLFPARFMSIQGNLAFLLVLFVGPSLVAPDLRNNGLPLYLARPFGRTDYVLGKLSVLAILLSAITWIPGLLLWAFQAYLMGWQWLTDNLRMAFGIFVASWVWILVLSILALALSALARWKWLAGLGLLAVYLFGGVFGGLINLLFDTEWGRLLNMGDMIHVVRAGLFGEELFFDFPLWAAWMSLLAVGGASVALLARKIRAYEVVR